ncbi:serine/arginine-rich splicing factor 7 isoform X1 [Salmo salar]|uniref:Serine/arginine-rich splicing factor 7-like isoform X1 n=1 Tax=Salmo salar TaxID=8030 RepID=B5XG14_SALSA|nr:serine/arginine-rich splicing factor 7 isoform X1 [Salmo salar]XP_014069397.1 serine/arginine-rich splicing factor 7 isoform X1 [Salmo salar]XP_014069399.1 serine/arginine-rich splicing factor 7 isoform X1 [Salmo salar]XP_014069400.1 serine/arginine-rich splicing factor 7 isoform X1 [Salmo salar]ACI69784.1 Splicing factor, arginine/serine-rich 7 [Salmo salar]ACI70191.1 Splicing factor, arginine/serine-rich 7 [Salmo salar]|eukprot:XP_014069396.1 PREDICTED: serine/arginine-rich splicing factor 7-like isoform X1 [Salmo salar]
MSYHSSSHSSSPNTNCKVYVGDIVNGATMCDLEREFSQYGPLRSVWVARPPVFGFVEYADARDAEDAVKGMDGKVVWGSRIHVELARKAKHDHPSNHHIDPQGRCNQCGNRGHYAYNCERFSKRGGGRRSRSRSRSGSRSRGSRYRSRSRSNDHSRHRSPSYPRQRKRSGFPVWSKSSTSVRSRSRSPSQKEAHPRRRLI